VIEPVAVSPEDLLDATDAYVLRRLLHGRYEMCLECCSLPGELGVRDQLRAQPHHQGELWGCGTDEGLHLGCVRELLVQVLHLAQQMAIAVLDGAGDLMVAAVAIHNQTAG
jgi:hypothetical protein